jgi:hypothetical protein
MHPFGREKVQWTFSSARLIPLKGREIGIVDYLSTTIVRI